MREAGTKSGGRGKGQITQALAARYLGFGSLQPEVGGTYSGFEKITLVKMWPAWRQEGRLGGQSEATEVVCLRYSHSWGGEAGDEQWTVSGTSTAFRKLTL